MSVNYNTLRAMNGMAVGTIIPWSGNISGDFGVPKGWLACTTNRTVLAAEYPELYEVIGNQYGGNVGAGTFGLPSLPGFPLVDYHTSHASDCGYTGNFASFIDDAGNSSNQNTTIQQSNIDLHVTLGSISGNLSASFEGMNIISSTFVSSFGYVPRKLGDTHFGTHTHPDEIPSVRISNEQVERCQNNFTANCIPIFSGSLNCADECEGFRIPRSGPNDSNDNDDFCVPRYDGGQHVGFGEIPYGTNGGMMTRGIGDRKNFISLNADAIFKNQTSAMNNPSSGSPGTPVPGNPKQGTDGAWEGIYATTLNHPQENFVNTFISGHDHQASFISVAATNIRTKEVVRINTMSTSNITPVNSQNTSIATITANTTSPSMQMLYIIKAY